MRLLLVPAVLFLAVAGTAFGLAKAHLAKPGAPKASGTVEVGDPYQGEIVFEQTCAGCHGEGGEGGGIGPRLEGAAIPLAVAKAQIDNGGGTMPARLVTGKQERDVLAYLATIFAPAQ